MVLARFADDLDDVRALLAPSVMVDDSTAGFLTFTFDTRSLPGRLTNVHQISRAPWIVLAHWHGQARVALMRPPSFRPIQDKTIVNVLHHIRSSILRDGLEGLEHVDALLCLRGVDPASLYVPKKWPND